MAPDVEELIKRVNTLTLDKNRLKQKLAHVTNGGATNVKDLTARSTNKSTILEPVPNEYSTTGSSYGPSNDIKTSSPSSKTNIIAGVECATACEDDLLYINGLFRKRLEEYDANWDFLQSKCSSLLSELDALQRQHIRIKKENLELENKYQKKCEENEEIRSEMQTVVLNYESQLGAMSEHLSNITGQLNLENENSQIRSLRNPNYID